MNRLTNLVWKLNSVTLATHYYQLGATGSRTSLTETVHGTNHVYSWQYDPLYRLTNEGISAIGTNGYDMDVVGNRLLRAGSDPQTNAFSTNDWLTTNSYDSNGNTLSTTNGGTNSGPYYYDVENRLTNFNGASFGYNGDGVRVSKSVAGTNTYYLVDDRNLTGYAQVVEEWTSTTGSATLSRVYNYGMGLISQQVSTNGPVHYYGMDGHGSVRFLTDTNGLVTDDYAYDAYGNLIASSGTTVNLYLYCGEQFDADLGMYYLRARYYRTDTGRFWTSDTFQGIPDDPKSLHKYLYCEADPVNMADPDGHDSLDSMIFPVFSVIMGASTTPLGTVAIGGAHVIVFISVDPAGLPGSFDCHRVQKLLEDMLLKSVFYSSRPGDSFLSEVVKGSSTPEPVGWHKNGGNGVNTYYNQVTWTHGTLTRHDFAYSMNGKTTIDLTHISAYFAHFGGTPSWEGDQFWANMLAHEVYWINAGNNKDDRSAPDGEISSPHEWAFHPFDATPAEAATLTKEFGF